MNFPREIRARKRHAQCRGEWCRAWRASSVGLAVAKRGRATDQAGLEAA